MNCPKVSVIVPNYNHARFLDQRMETILNQTFRDFEVIFLDDASTDNSLEVFEKYRKNKHITKVIINKVNSGSPFKQWNKGIIEAKGDYIWIAESDDYADHTLLESLVEILDQHHNVGLAYCRSWVVDDDENRSDQLFQFDCSFFGTKRWDSDYINDGKLEVENYLAYINTIHNASSALFRRSVVGTVGLANEGMRLCGDWFLWSKILCVSDIAFVANKMNYHRIVKTSTTNVVGNTVPGLVENYQIVKWNGQLKEIAKTSNYYREKILDRFAVEAVLHLVFTPMPMEVKRKLLKLAVEQYRLISLPGHLAALFPRIIYRVGRRYCYLVKCRINILAGKSF